MNAAARQHVELAQQDARRRQHATTEPEHLLAAMLGVEAIAVVVHRRGLDPNELRERLEAALAAIPSIASYRDTASATLSPALERARASRRRP